MTNEVDFQMLSMNIWKWMHLIKQFFKNCNKLLYKFEGWNCCTLKYKACCVYNVSDTFG